RYLTKSRFKLARECPAKLFYTGKKKEYPDKKSGDSFLEALADGGFQVGELAKCYYPGGFNIDSLDYEDALAKTNKLLQREKVVIFEAAFRYNNLFCRADILVKDGRHFDLIEVKAKSFNSSKGPDGFLKSDKIDGDWRAYLEDVAFQKYVLEKAFPDYLVTPYLMLADKDSWCPTDGLNQKFKLYEKNGRKGIIVSPPITPEDISKKILCQIPVNEMCGMIYDADYGDGTTPVSFSELVEKFADCYARDEKIPMPIARKCKKCEFRANGEDKALGLKSGFEECWKEQLGWTDKDFEEPSIFEIWFLNSRTGDKWIKDRLLKISQITSAEFTAAPMGEGYTTKGRQLLQIEKTQKQDKTCWIDKEGLAAEMNSWVFPLHLIDFETAMPAIPFNKWRRPYEGIAFQFSHHVVNEDGSMEHKGEYINTVPGKYPNFDFIRALKSELENDTGSIFRYAVHENTYLNMIETQIREDIKNVPDSGELIDFIRSITQSGGKSLEIWKGARNMIDMCELVKYYYYDPYMKGSNSIKVVLPAMLNGSSYLQKKYAEPIYGAEGGIKSRNYKDWVWIELDEDGSVKDPYHRLPKLFEDLTDEQIEMLDAGELFSTNDELHDGGAAMTAYAKIQFAEMSYLEREQVRKALLKYCELD
ncbi:MAG: DUF2779 domain-containing protein, partial [Eubacteriales bacterium]